MKIRLFLFESAKSVVILELFVQYKQNCSIKQIEKVILPNLPQDFLSQSFAVRKQG